MNVTLFVLGVAAAMLITLILPKKKNKNQEPEKE